MAVLTNLLFGITFVSNKNRMQHEGDIMFIPLITVFLFSSDLKFHLSSHHFLRQQHVEVCSKSQKWSAGPVTGEQPATGHQLMYIQNLAVKMIQLQLWEMKISTFQSLANTWSHRCKVWEQRSFQERDRTIQFFDGLFYINTHTVICKWPLV